jgi:hypothetical protein
MNKRLPLPALRAEKGHKAVWMSDNLATHKTVAVLAWWKKYTPWVRVENFPKNITSKLQPVDRHVDCIY